MESKIVYDSYLIASWIWATSSLSRISSIRSCKSASLPAWGPVDWTHIAACDKYATRRWISNVSLEMKKKYVVIKLSKWYYRTEQYEKHTFPVEQVGIKGWLLSHDHRCAHEIAIKDPSNDLSHLLQHNDEGMILGMEIYSETDLNLKNNLCHNRGNSLITFKTHFPQPFFFCK